MGAERKESALTALLARVSFCSSQGELGLRLCRAYIPALLLTILGNSHPNVG